MIAKWKDREGNELSWVETLRSMCKYYGTFCGRWHSNEFWARELQGVDALTEEQAKQRIIEIEQEADRELAFWQAYQ